MDERRDTRDERHETRDTGPQRPLAAPGFGQPGLPLIHPLPKMSRDELACHPPCTTPFCERETPLPVKILEVFLADLFAGNFGNCPLFLQQVLSHSPLLGPVGGIVLASFCRSLFLVFGGFRFLRFFGDFVLSPLSFALRVSFLGLFLACIFFLFCCFLRFVLFPSFPAPRRPLEGHQEAREAPSSSL